MEFDLVKLIETVGYLGLFLIIFAESGLFFGFFFPGDSLLLTAGLLASRGIMEIRILIPLLFVAAVLGDNIGYWFGAKTGPRLFTRPDSLLFKRDNLLKAHAFYEKHGGKTITLARWVPVVRTFAPIVAGAASMEYRRFLTFNLLGAFLWAVGMPLLGYGLGLWFGSVEGIDKYFTILVLLFFFIPGIPTLIHIWRDNREKLVGLFRTRVLRQKPAASPPRRPKRPSWRTSRHNPFPQNRPRPLRDRFARRHDQIPDFPASNGSDGVVIRAYICASPNPASASAASRSTWKSGRCGVVCTSTFQSRSPWRNSAMWKSMRPAGTS